MLHVHEKYMAIARHIHCAYSMRPTARNTAQSSYTPLLFPLQNHPFLGWKLLTKWRMRLENISRRGRAHTCDHQNWTVIPDTLTISLLVIQHVSFGFKKPYNTLLNFLTSTHCRTRNYRTSLILNHYNSNFPLAIGISHQVNKHQRC